MTTQTTATTARRAWARRPGTPLTDATLARVDAWWRAANYLSVGQIHLRDDPLLREPITTEHVKPRLLGHWGTTPGLDFLDAHLNRVIRERDQSTVYLTGPGHGSPGLVANAYLDGTCSQVRDWVWPDAGETRTEASGPTYPDHGAGTTATGGDNE